MLSVVVAIPRPTKCICAYTHFAERHIADCKPIGNITAYDAVQRMLSHNSNPASPSSSTSSSPSKQGVGWASYIGVGSFIEFQDPINKGNSPAKFPFYINGGLDHKWVHQHNNVFMHVPTMLSP